MGGRKAIDVRKTPGEVTTFKGCDVISFWVSFEGKDGKVVLRPTTKGVTFRRGLLPEVLAALQSLLDKDDCSRLRAPARETGSDSPIPGLIGPRFALRVSPAALDCNINLAVIERVHKLAEGVLRDRPSRAAQAPKAEHPHAPVLLFAAYAPADPSFDRTLGATKEPRNLLAGVDETALGRGNHQEVVANDIFLLGNNDKDILLQPGTMSRRSDCARARAALCGPIGSGSGPEGGAARSRVHASAAVRRREIGDRVSEKAVVPGQARQAA